jgi:hypothetical protein
MRYSKLFAWCALAVGMAAPGASTLAAADRWDTYRDLHRDYGRVDRMRDDIARDRARLNEDIRCGRRAAAGADARDLARDQQALNSQIRDIQRDRNRDEGRRW